MSKCLLRLYIAGDTVSSRRARHNLARLTEAMRSPCDAEVVDVLNEPQRAEKAGIIATPTLSYENGARVRRAVGDLRDIKRVLDFLGIEMRDDAR